MTPDARDGLDPYGDSLDLRRLALGLARSARWIVATTVVGLVAGLAYGLVKPNEFESEGKIEVRLGMRERRTPDSSLNPSEVPPPAPGIGDEIELLYNPEVYRRVARQVGPQRLLAPYDPTVTDGPDTLLPLRWLHRAQAWWFARQHEELGPEAALEEAALMAEEAIEVSSLPNTSYLVVHARASTAELARDLTAAYVATARQWHREVYASRTELTFVSDQLERYEQESKTAESALAEHRQQCGFYDIETQKQSLVADIDELQARIRENTIRLFEVEDELAFVEREREATPPMIEKLIPPSVRVNPEYQAVLDRLQKLRAERADLPAVYTEGSELFQRKAEPLERQIQALEQQLARTSELVEYTAPTPEKSENPRYEELTFRRNDLRQEQETRTKTRQLWEQSRQAQEQRLQAAIECEPRHRDLARDVERTKARVMELASALERAQALALLDRQEDMDSLRIAQDGVLPRTKTGPNRRRYLTLGLFGGLAAGLFLAALLYLVDTRLYQGEDLQEALDLPVLGVIPEVRAWRRAGASARRRARAGSPG